MVGGDLVVVGGGYWNLVGIVNIGCSWVDIVSMDGRKMVYWLLRRNGISKVRRGYRLEGLRGMRLSSI